MAAPTEDKTQTRRLWPTEHNHVLLISGLSFWAGCVLAARFSSAAPLWLLAALAVAMGALLHKLGRRGGIALALMMLALGGLRTLPSLHPAQPAPAVYETITGYVRGEPRLRADSRITFTLDNVTLDGVIQQGRAYCSCYYGGHDVPALFDGAELSFSGRVYLPEGKSGAPRFDFQRWMLQNGMTCGIAISQGITVRNTPDTAPVMDWAYRLRSSFKAALSKTMGDSAGLAMAMLLGEKEGVAEQEYAAFQRLGIAHVMAVSGLHVGLLGMMLLALLKKLPRGWRLLITGVFLLGYSGLTGFAASTLRASVMLMLLLINEMLGRRREPLAALGAAMLIVLVINPLQAASIGFVLSFTAVAGLALLTPVFRRAFDRVLPDVLPKRLNGLGFRGAIFEVGRRGAQWFKKALSASLAAQMGVLLPVAMAFHSVPLYGVWINLLIIPLTGLLVPTYAAALALSAVPLLGEGVGWVAALLSKLLLALVTLLARLPYASIRVASPDPLWFVAAMAAVAALSRRVRAAAWRRAAAVALICGITGLAVYSTRLPDTRYIQLSVGQADASLIVSGDQTVAIDVGGDGAATVDYLMASGRDLDALYLTHLHLDHAGGVAALLEAGIKIRQVYLPVNGEQQRLEPESLAILTLLEENEIPVSHLARGDELRYNGVVIKALWPDQTKVRRMQDANDLPLVLSIDLDGCTLLSASDLTGSYERYAAIPCDVLKVAHHGSRDSSFDDFLTFTQPGMALISCSSGSQSLPSAETLQRLWEHDIPVLRTDQSGDITLWVENGALHIAPYR